MNRSRYAALFLVLLAVTPACHRRSNLISASGTVEVVEVDLSSRITGRIEKLYTDEGLAVRKGDILAKLDDRLVVAQKNAAEAAFIQSQRNFERSKNLLASRSITQEQFDAASSQYTKASADLAQARVMYDESAITAPWDGVILKKDVEVGELVAANSPVFTLGDTGRAKVTIYVPLPDLGLIRPGAAAQVSVDSFLGRQFSGQVTRIAGEAEFTPKNVQTRDERVKEVFAVEITVPNPDYALKPGMPADVAILIPHEPRH